MSYPIGSTARWKWPAVVAGVVLVASLAASCATSKGAIAPAQPGTASSPAATPTVDSVPTSASGSNGGTGASGGHGGSVGTFTVPFAQCMRSHGVPNFPDPDGSAGQLGPYSGIDPASAVFQSALNGPCRSLAPQAWIDSGPGSVPGQ
ncbi:MAG: hypothetical protein HOV87_11670 [Catenulispora sp.]|nr:hypothetical protein [Catenulispora sp.]